MTVIPGQRTVAILLCPTDMSPEVLELAAGSSTVEQIADESLF
jgi:hypothetical protein